MDPLLMFGEESKRLKFRKLVAEDFEAWKPLFYEKEPAEYLGLDTSMSPEKLCEAWFNKSNWRYDNSLGGMNVIVDKATDELIGQSGLLIQEMEGKKWLEGGYSILANFWKQGFESEASANEPIPVVLRPKNWRRFSIIWDSDRGSMNASAFCYSFVQIQDQACDFGPRGMFGPVKFFVAR